MELEQELNEQMSNIQRNLDSVELSLENLFENSEYDVEKFTFSLAHLTHELEFFYCTLAKDKEIDDTYFYIRNRPRQGQLAYFNIGRGFPKELMDGHWCYILKDLGYKAIVIPVTSIKEDSTPPNDYEMDIMSKQRYNNKIDCRLQFADIRCVDYQRLDTRKRARDVTTDKLEIIKKLLNILL